MKKLVLFFLVVLHLYSFAQNRFKAGLKIGISTSQVEGDTYAGFHKVGIDGGAFVNARFSERLNLQMEMFFIQKGSKHNPETDKGDFSLYYLQLNYLEIPLLINYKIKRFSFELGPGYSYLIKENEYNEYQELTGLWPFKKNEYSINIGVSYSWFKNFGINWRYTNSLTAIREYSIGAPIWFNKGQGNNVLAFTLTYQFGKNE